MLIVPIVEKIEKRVKLYRGELLVRKLWYPYFCQIDAANHSKKFWTQIVATDK